MSACRPVSAGRQAEAIALRGLGGAHLRHGKPEDGAARLR
jgi:hypothetical protein